MGVTDQLKAVESKRRLENKNKSRLLHLFNVIYESFVFLCLLFSFSFLILLDIFFCETY